MNWREKIQLAWQNKGTITEGFFNAYVLCSQDVKKEALGRLEICRANTCGLYNPQGKNEGELKAVFPGKESCGGCGCDLYAKTHAMSAHCYLKDLNDPEKPPFWDAVLTHEQEMEINKIAYQKQFENRKNQQQNNDTTDNG